MAAAQVDYRRDIDGLRAVAIGVVVAFHAFPNFVKGGYIGVDVFFVISGYLITGHILQGLTAGNFSYLDFYGRRIRRIFPALIAVSAAAFAVGWFVLLPDEFRQLGKHLAAGAGFISNIAFWNEAGYFDRAYDLKPLLHLWSLGVEEQFYLIWPALLGLLWRTGRVAALVILIGLLSFAANIALTTVDQTAAYFLPVSRFWELMVGGILAYAAIHRSNMVLGFANLASAAGLALIVIAALLLTRASTFPGYWALLPTVGAALVIAAGPQALINRFVLASAPMVGLGLISYALYLWHWPILVFAKLVKEWPLTPGERVAAVAVAVALAVATYWWIERPCRRLTPRRIAMPLSGAMTAVAAIGLVAFVGAMPSRLKSDGVSKILSASTDWEYPPAAAARLGGPLRAFRQSGAAGAFTLFLGDSHMEQYAPRIDRAIRENAGARGAVLVGNQSGCQVIRAIAAPDDGCGDAARAVAKLAADPTTKAVVFSVAWSHYTGLLADAAAGQRFAEFVRSISAAKLVYLILDNPIGDELSPRNMFTGSRLGTIEPKPTSALRFDLDGYLRKYGAVRQLVTGIAERNGAAIIDPIQHLCPDTRCPVFDDNGVPLYLDEGHFTRSYAARAVTYIDRTLKP